MCGVIVLIVVANNPNWPNTNFKSFGGFLRQQRTGFDFLIFGT